jgi:predicted nuclease of predicted toxin-antitoxin system
MKFLVDAQLPRRLVRRLREAGHEALHTLDLPLGNRTTDAVINELSERERYAVITKDADFVNSFLLSRRPYKLLLISTGNISNAELEVLFVSNLERIAEGFDTLDFIELDRKALIFHV